MKKLLNCSARYDDNNLVSYSTQVVKIQNGYTFVHCYRSNTTLSHIRKFADVTHNSLVKDLYRMCITNKALCAIYDGYTGEVILENDYEKAIATLKNKMDIDWA